jgi:hypothetical protein
MIMVCSYWFNEAILIAAKQRPYNHVIRNKDIKYVNSYIKKQANVIATFDKKISIRNTTMDLLYLQVWPFSLITYANGEGHPSDDLIKYADEHGFDIKSTLLPDVILYEFDPNRKLRSKSNINKLYLPEIGKTFNCHL